MTSLGRLIFLDQPGTGASDPVTPGALPTLEQWADSITAVLDVLGSSEAVLLAVDGALAPAALFAATHPSRTTSLVALEAYANPLAQRWGGRPPRSPHPRKPSLTRSPSGERVSSSMQSIRTCRGTRRSGQHGRDTNAWPRAQGPSLSCVPSWPKWTCGHSFRQSACQPSSSTTPMTRSSCPSRQVRRRPHTGREIR